MRSTPIGEDQPRKSDVAAGWDGYRPGVAHTYPPLNVEVRTPRLRLAGASDEMLERLVPLVRAGVADAEPWPFDDPISFYADSPEREWQWLRGIWAGREAGFDHVASPDTEHDVAIQLRFPCDQVADHIGPHHLLVYGIGHDMLAVERHARFGRAHPLKRLHQPSRTL